jgi:hypothetical protein
MVDLSRDYSIYFWRRNKAASKKAEILFHSFRRPMGRNFLPAIFGKVLFNSKPPKLRQRHFGLLVDFVFNGELYPTNHKIQSLLIGDPTTRFSKNNQ